MHHTDYRKKYREVHKDFSEHLRYCYLVVNSSDKNVTEYITSANFKILLPQDMAGQNQRNLRSISYQSGTLPNFDKSITSNARPYLFLSIPELESNVMNHNIKDNATSLLRYSFDATETGRFLETIEYNPMDNLYLGKGLARELTFKIYNSTGTQFDFGGSVYTATSFTNTNPTIVSIPGHTLVVNDIVYVRKFTNASTVSVGEMIMSNDPYPVIATGAGTITINLNLASEAVNQTRTGTPGPYPLGGGSRIVGPTQNPIYFMNGVTSFSTTNPTVFNTGGAPHNFTTGSQIVISGFSNGSTMSVNIAMNSTFIITVLTPSTFSIPVDLSGEAANQIATGTPPPYPLGQGALILDDKKQTTFNFLLTINAEDNPKY